MRMAWTNPWRHTAAAHSTSKRVQACRLGLVQCRCVARLLRKVTRSCGCAKQRQTLQEQQHKNELEEQESCLLSLKTLQLAAQEDAVARLEGEVASLREQLGERQGLLEAASAGNAELQAAAAARVRHVL
jgi:hypothetical protein